ncbi:MAG: SLC13 family permease [Bacillota bacterium]
MKPLVALLIFSITYVGIASEKVPRHVIGLFGALCLMLAGVMDLNKAITYVNWDTIGLLLGMFVLMAVLADAGFFQYLANWVAAKLGYNPAAVIVVFPVLAALLAAFMDSITVVLFLSALSLDLCKLLQVNPVPLVIAEVCGANIGGAATLVGDPPNVILGTMLGFGFADFLRGTGPVALLCLALTVAWFKLATLRDYPNRRVEHPPIDPGHAINDRRMMVLGLLGLIVAVLLLITYRYIDDWLKAGISPAVASLIPALTVLILGGETTRETFSKIDGESLLFFIALFMVIGGLEETGIVSNLGAALRNAAGSSTTALIAILAWGSGLLSGVVDNVPLAVTMGYLVRYLASQQGQHLLSWLTWAVALGVDIGGNLTPIGASANVVGYATLDKRGYRVGWKQWLLYAAPPTLLSLLATSAVIAARARLR